MSKQFIGTNTSYHIPVEIDQNYNGLINPIDVSPLVLKNITNTSQVLLNTHHNFVADHVMASYTRNEAVPGESVPTDEGFWYLIKTGATYSFQKEKPLTYLDFKEIYLDGLVNGDMEITNKLIQNSLKASLGTSYIKSMASTSWTLYSFPVGGISRFQAYFYYLSGSNIKPLHLSKDVKIDLLEGNVYISNSFKDNIDQLFGYFDVEPLKISQTDYLTISGQTESSFYSMKQKSFFGDITINNIEDESYAISLSFNAFIAPSDPFFISVDGINLLKPRYIPKNTTILVRQSFKVERDNIMNEAVDLFLGVESEDISSLASFITRDTEESINTFQQENTASGLFIYKEVANLAFDTSNALYLPLFKKQDIIREITND